MKRFLSIALVSLALAGHTTAMARPSVAIINHESVEVTPARTGAGDAQRVQQAIVAAGMQRNWNVRPLGDGEMEASLLVRGKHTVVVGIRYTASQFSLVYKSSVNMNFETRDGQPLIHPNYNKWVNDLKQGIQFELQKT